MTQPAPDNGEPFIARDATYHQASAALRERVHDAVATEARARTTGTLKRAVGFGFAFAAVAAVSWNLALLQPGARTADLVERDVVSAHMRSVMPTGKLIDVPSSDRHEVKPWFTGKVDFAPPVPDLSARGFVLVGGRLDYVDGRTVATVTYRYRLHVVNVFEWPSSRDIPPETRTRQGYNMVHWARDGMERWAISDLAVPELREITEN
jgi:anti-sigma factor RsiW